MARRELWNAAAAAARARGADRTAMAAALCEVGAALADAGPTHGSPALLGLADALVPAALDLVAQRRWSAPGGGSAQRRALLAAPALVAHCGPDGRRSPAVLSDLLSAAGRLQRWGDAPAWLERLVAAATTAGAVAAADSAPDLLRRLGVVAAWRSGAVRLRRAALASARRVPADAACAALSLPELGAERLARVLEEHAADPWWWPDGGRGRGAGVGPGRPVVARLGGFRGFGGPWARPPRVLGPLDREGAAWDVATDHPDHPGDPGRLERWRVLADVHGVAVHRWSPGLDLPVRSGGTGAGTAPPGALPWDDEVTGRASAGRTAVLSRAHSHLLDVVLLDARGPL